MTPALNTKVQIQRDDSDSRDFAALILLLDADLLSRYGEKQNFFNQFNKVDKIKHVVIAYADSRVPVGCGAIKKHDDKSAEVKRIFVKEEYRGRGIGAKIMAELESWASELDFSHCILETGAAQPEAVNLYKKLGYKITENYPPYVGVEISICMKKDL